jgi:5-methylcytosine-specific restriction endonuclease McrA
MCGRKCRTSLGFNHPRQATVDHYPRPLSKGGDHDWDNVRCACRQCNTERGAKWDGQLRMRM